jgi:hypothetical protein
MSTPDSKVTCKSCGREATPNFAKCLRDGWPECCGSTMQLISTQADIEQAVGGAVSDGLTAARVLLNTQEEA